MRRDEAELDFPARDCRAADDKTLTKTFDAIVYTAPGIYEYTVTQDAGGRNGPTTRRNVALTCRYGHRR